VGKPSRSLMQHRTRTSLNPLIVSLIRDPPPAEDFAVKQANDNEGKILGYTVLATTRSETDYLVRCVVDMTTLPDRHDVADLLLQEATDFFDDQDINIAISLVVQNTPCMKVYQRHGFLNSRIQPKMFYYSLTDKDEFKKLMNTPPRRIHFSYGDVDSLPAKLPQYI
jgi:GNAT superfamily N-acetyltransferase